MRSEQREHALRMLFGSTLKQLDELRDSGIDVPSEIYLYLGMLQGNLSGIMNHIATNNDLELERLKRKICELELELDLTDGDVGDAVEEEEEELPTRMEQVQRNVDNVRSPLARRQKIVQLREQSDSDD